MQPFEVATILYSNSKQILILNDRSFSSGPALRTRLMKFQFFLPVYNYPSHMAFIQIFAPKPSVSKNKSFLISLVYMLAMLTLQCLASSHITHDCFSLEIGNEESERNQECTSCLKNRNVYASCVSCTSSMCIIEYQSCDSQLCLPVPVL